ncbi:hypothetical protein [Rhizobium leguminosarum]|uniref:hypothetical protein n=1 Tax=Rhizobium leguminosarum TaxID=384 RepID=UPI001C95D695|nr:hypothetical protein [Rhizobium leguminosarum]MBY5318228.1 hypothetical protein [Rhizobium leguminosarum]
MRKTMTAPPLDVSDVERIAADAGIDLEEVEAAAEEIAKAPAFAGIEAQMARIVKHLDIELEVSMKSIAVAEEFLRTGFVEFDKQAASIINEFEANFVTGKATFDPEPETPLTIAQAACLPELGGRLLRSKGLSLKSSTVAEKTLRGAIGRGELAHVWLNDKNMFVTRQGIKEWLERMGTPSTGRRMAPKKMKDEVTTKDIRDRQKGTRSSLQAHRVEETMTAMERARLRIEQGRANLKK